MTTQEAAHIVNNITDAEIRKLVNAYRSLPIKLKEVYPNSFRMELVRILQGKPKLQIRVGSF